MKIIHIALGGCLRAPPVSYGLTADTGGHIAYLLSAASAQAACDPATTISLFTRRFDDERLGAIHGEISERVSPTVTIERIETRDARYLEKEALAAELPEFTQRFLARLENGSVLPSVIHAHFADAAAVALAARERFGIPFVYTPHALALDKMGRCGDAEAMGARICAERLAIQSADAVVVSSRDEAERQIAAYDVNDAAARTLVISPGVPSQCDRTRIMQPLVFDDARRPIVLAIARPTHKKNLVAVAESFVASRLKEHANLIVLAGQSGFSTEGKEERDVRQRLRHILSAPDLAGRVALPPRHSSADVRALYRRATASGGVFVSPALHEPFGLTLIEAAAAGLPVVATAHGGAADIVRRIGHGLIVEPQDRTAIADACLRIIEDRFLHRRLSEASAGHAAAYSWDVYGRRSMRLYASLAASFARPGAVAA